MKPYRLFLAVLCSLAGCAPHQADGQRVSILANRWGIGEHKTCTFLIPEGLFCDADAPITHFEAAQARESLSKSVVVEKGDYDASFSTETPDYSLWDCLKTGNANIAIACSLVHRPSPTELQSLQLKDGQESGAAIEAARKLLAETQKQAAETQKFIQKMRADDQKAQADAEYWRHPETKPIPDAELPPEFRKGSRDRTTGTFGSGLAQPRPHP